MEAGQTAQRNEFITHALQPVSLASMEAGQTAQRNESDRGVDITIAVLQWRPGKPPSVTETPPAPPPLETGFNGGRANRPA